jgi:hypothetical protein
MRAQRWTMGSCTTQEAPIWHAWNGNGLGGHSRTPKLSVTRCWIRVDEWGQNAKYRAAWGQYCALPPGTGGRSDTEGLRAVEERQETKGPTLQLLWTVGKSQAKWFDLLSLSQMEVPTACAIACELIGRFVRQLQAAPLTTLLLPW